MVIGFYEVNGKSIGRDAGFNVGDVIVKVNDKDVNSIEEMLKYLKEEVTFTILRDGKKKSIDGIALIIMFDICFSSRLS